MKKKWFAAFIIYLALITACIVVVYAVPSVKGMLEKSYVTEYGKIDITDKVSAYIVRDETVYVAAHDFEINRVAEQDTLIKAGARVAELTPIIDEDAAESGEGEQNDISRKYEGVLEDLNGDWVVTENGRTDEAGYVSYFVDGAEAALSTDRLADLKKSDYESLSGRRSVDTPKSKCGKGEPLFKVTHNRKWYLVFYIDNEAGEKYYEGRSVSVEIAGKNVPVKVSQVEVGNTTTKVTLTCKTFFEGFTGERSLNTTITVASAEGLVLQDSSIVMKGDQPGVFVKNKLGEHRFKPISIKADDGKRCVVYSDIFVDAGGNYVETVNTYDEIVAEPTEEEIAALQEQAAAEAAEKAQKEAARKAAEEKAAAEAAAAEQAAAEQAAAEAAAAEAAAAEAAAAEQANPEQAAAEQAEEAQAIEDNGGAVEGMLPPEEVVDENNPVNAGEG